jgi:hypothetical protein
MAVGNFALTTRHPSISKKFVLTSLTSGGQSVGIVGLQTNSYGVSSL